MSLITKILAPFLVSIFSSFLNASVNDYIFPFRQVSFSNYGTVGLIQNPSSRFLEEGSLAISWSHNEPYLRGSIIAYPFSWLEASYQYTDINNQLYSLVPEFSGTQSLKDKSFDFKLRVFQEKKFMPQLAIGVRDLGGTGLFSAEYVVANKMLSRALDVSIGVGWGNLNGNLIDNPLSILHERFDSRISEDSGEGGRVQLDSFFTGSAGLFGGLEYAIPNFYGVRLKFEYDGTNYQTEAAKGISQASKINFGLVYPLNKDMVTKLSFTRGNTINFGFSYKLGLNKKQYIKKSKATRLSINNSDIVKSVTNKSVENLYKASILYLSKDNINLQKANISEDSIHVVYAQSKYKSPAMSSGRTIAIIDQVAPARIKKITVSEINGNLGMYTASINRELLNRSDIKNIPELAERYITTGPFDYNDNEFKYQPTSYYPAVFSSLGPDLRSQIGGPDGFFFGDLRLTLNTEIKFRNDLSLMSEFSYGLFDNMGDLKQPSDSILPHVRSDIVQYLREGRGFSIGRMQFNYFNQISSSLFFKASGGILESMFNGVGFELLYRPFFSNYGIGVEGWQVYQRDYDQMFNNIDYDIVTGHVTLYYKEPRSKILFQFKGGRYLAGDSGFTLDFSRVFRSGLRIGSFFSLTDISFEEFGEGSFDKGFYFQIPLDFFTYNHTKKNFSWGLRPLTRDGAQQVMHGFPLWGVTNSSDNNEFFKNIDDFFK